jgi:hypothetical protein
VNRNPITFAALQFRNTRGTWRFFRREVHDAYGK